MVFLNINTQQLRYFMELAKCLNFTRAAANLYVAQPTLSQQIAELETQLGVSLFTRSSRSVSLTPAGTILYEAYPDILEQMNRIRQNMLITAAGFKGALHIGFGDAFTYSLPPILRAFRDSFPNIAVRPVCRSHNELSSGLKNHTLDLVFSMVQDFAAEDLAFCSKKLIRSTPLCFVLPAGYSLTPDCSFARKLPLIMFSEAADSCYPPYVKELLKKLDISPADTIFADSLGDLRAYLESGIGFSVLPETLSGSFSAARFFPISGEVLELGALWDPDSANPALPLFLEALEQFLEPGSPAP